MQDHIAAIKDMYNHYYTTLFLKGDAPFRQTELGLWGVAAADEVVQVFQKLRLERFRKFIDLGSGDGKVVFLAGLFTDATGIEIDPELVKRSRMMQQKLQVKGTVLQDDYRSHDLSRYDIVFIHPDKPFYDIEAKLARELKGLLVVYNAIYKPLQLHLKKRFSVNSTEVCVYGKNKKKA